jgi:general L-amino acid transport system permease protein
MTIELKPPIIENITPINWAKKNLFSTWYNTLLTLISLWVIFAVSKGFILWVLNQAKWKVIEANFPLFFVGRYPHDEYWRLWLCLDIIILLSGLTWTTFYPEKPLVTRSFLLRSAIGIVAIVVFPIDLISRLWLLSAMLIFTGGNWLGKMRFFRGGKLISFLWVLSFPIILWLIQGGLGLKEISTNDWGGLMLTLFAASVSIFLSFPLGVLLALGRQSSLPIVRWFCLLYIEIIRGLPLIGILFLGQVMLQFFLPPGTPKLDRVVRAIASLSLFSAAYLAENVRGGLQSIPRGQIEAARSLGLNPPLVIILIILPQALRAVIPAIVGQFIGLFKDTSLLALFGLLELVGISKTILANPSYIGRYAEIYVFIGVIYWIFCYGMSLASRHLEKQLDIRQK